MVLFYPAQMSGGTLLHLLAIHIAVLLFFSYFSVVVVYIYIDL